MTSSRRSSAQGGLHRTLTVNEHLRKFDPDALHEHRITVPASYQIVVPAKGWIKIERSEFRAPSRKPIRRERLVKRGPIQRERLVKRPVGPAPNYAAMDFIDLQRLAQEDAAARKALMEIVRRSHVGTFGDPGLDEPD